ncbi:MAG: class I SAM-dependent methyltransferase [Eubacteriales bacterium]
MQLSPEIYHKLIRPKWFVKNYLENTINNYFDFNDKIVIDFGCGVGSLTPLFKSKHYIGLDCDAKRVSYARHLNPNHSFYTIKDNRIPLKNNSVDYVLFISVLHHIPSRTIEEYTSELQRILKPEGSIVAMEPCIIPEKTVNNFFMRTFDKGKYIRTSNEYLDIFKKRHFNTNILNQFNQLFFYNKILFSAKVSLK